MAILDSGPTSAQSGSELDDDETACLLAVLDTLWPDNGHGPSAADVGLAAYTILSLADAYSSCIPLYSAWLRMVDGLSMSSDGVPFAQLSETSRMQIISMCAADNNELGQGLAIVQEHAVEGLLCDPKYGGNRNLAGWKYVGFGGVRYFVSAEDQELGVTHEARIDPFPDLAPGSEFSEES